MSKSFKSLFKLTDPRELKDILRERYETQLRRERATVVKRMPPGSVYFRGRIVDYTN